MLAGSVAAQTQVLDLDTTGSSNPHNFCVVNNQLYFAASTPAAGDEIHRLSPNHSHVQIADINPGSDGCFPAYLTKHNQQLYFIAQNGSDGNQLWRYVPPAAPEMLSNGNPTNLFTGNPTFTDSLVGWNGGLVYSMNDQQFLVGDEPWWFAPNDEHFLLADIGTGFTGSAPRNFRVFNNRLYFSAQNANNGLELWEFDGVSVPALLADINPGPNDALLTQQQEQGLVVHNNRMYFTAQNGTNGYELWYVDDAGQVDMIELNPNGDAFPLGITSMNDHVYFTATDSSGARQLWRLESNDVPVSVGGISTTRLRTFGNRLYFLHDDGVHGLELWQSDGTSAPEMVADINPGPGDAFGLSSLTVNKMLAYYREKLYFVADNGINGSELWVYDGENAATMVADLNPGSASSHPLNLLPYNGSLYFTADDGTTGRELWYFTDTTSTGIHTPHAQGQPQAQLYPNPANSYVTISAQQEIEVVQLVDLNGKVLHTIQNPGKNCKLSLEQVPAGIYLVALFTPKGVSHYKVLKHQ